METEVRTYKSVKVNHAALTALTGREVPKLQVALKKQMRKKLAPNDLKNGDLLSDFRSSQAVTLFEVSISHPALKSAALPRARPLAGL